MGLEMTATRFIAPTFGNTVYTWGIIISIFLIGSSIGYVLGGHVADKKSGRTISLLLYLFSIVMISLVPFIKNIAFPFIEVLPSVIGTSIGVFLLYFIPNFLLSMMVPILMKEGLEKEMNGKQIGNLHTASAIGSVLGTLITTFLFIPKGHINNTILVLGVLLYAAYLLYYFKDTPIHKILLWLPIPFLLIPLLPNQNLITDELYHHTSLYNDIHIYETTQGNDVLRYMTFGNKTTIQGMMKVDEPNELVVSYTQSIYEATKHYAPKSKNVFMIGHGIGTLTKRYEQDKKGIVVAELDETVLDVSKKYFEYNGDSVVIGDGRKVLQEQIDSYDVIVLDAFRNTSHIPFHLVTKEFFLLTKEKLNEEGILLINAIGTPKEDEVLASLNTTLQQVYPYVYALGTSNENERQNILYLASSKHLDVTQMEGLRKMKLPNGIIIFDDDTKLKELN